MKGEDEETDAEQSETVQAGTAPTSDEEAPSDEPVDLDADELPEDE